jgi:hypothetical protein
MKRDAGRYRKHWTRGDVRRAAIGGLLFWSTVLAPPAREACAQIYGYTNDKGILILSNVPSDPRMVLIAEGNPEPAGNIWRYSGQYDALIMKAASLARVDSSLLTAVIAVESGFNRFARSHKGALGLMQLMPATCRRYGVTNPYDAWQNIRAGATHLRELLDEFKDLRLSLAAYNAGAGVVRRLGRIPSYPETQGYVRKVTAIYGAESRISIIKGGRQYSIGPGGTTRVQAASEAGREAAKASPTPGEAAGSQEESETIPVDEKPTYYRYTDANGVIYITRERPSRTDYEILRNP